MRKFLTIFLFSTASLFAASSFVNADTVSLKNGQIHTGDITAEEDVRIQMRIEGSGARIWFMRDQITSMEKDSPQESPEKEDKTATGLVVDKTGTPDDVTRAQELLQKMREQPKETTTPKKRPSNSASSNGDTGQQGAAGATVAANQDEVTALIEQMRKGKYYDRLEACKKLGNVGSKDAIPHLIHVLDDQDIYLRRAANDSLIKLTGQDFKFDAKDQRSVRLEGIERWEKWYKEEQRKEAGTQLKSFW